MPELPDITAYLAAIEPRVLHQPLLNLRIATPFLLRNYSPPIDAFLNKPVHSLRRIGKRIVFCFHPEPTAEPLFLVLHLMIAGRLHWRDYDPEAPKPKDPKKDRPKLGARNHLAAFDFPHGSLVLTEAGSKRRASLHAILGESALADLDPGGLDPLTLAEPAFIAALTSENRTLKRALTDPRVLSGIGNAYSDEILHAAQLSPLALTRKLPPEDLHRLFTATQSTLTTWTARLTAEALQSFPEKVTAFRPDMVVHGRFGLPCPRCASPIQRIRYADNETNYCPTCQTNGKLLADRGLSRLLGADWPRTLDELELLRKK